MRKTPLSAAVVCVLVCALIAPAAGAAVSSNQAKRDAARRRHAQLATQLDALKASDKELDAAVAALDTQVNAQRAAAILRLRPASGDH